MPLHVAHFVHRYPPAVGGAEAYFARLSEYLVGCGDTVTVFTSTAIELAEMWGKRGSRDLVMAQPGHGEPDRNSRLTVERYPTLQFPLRRYVLKTLSLLPVRAWQLLTSPSNPVCLQMWRESGRFDGPLDAVHATAFPYGFPLMCGLRLARRRGVPFLLTPFLHLGDPLDPNDQTRRQYTTAPLKWLLRQSDKVFVQTPGEYEQAHRAGVRDSRLVLQGLGVDEAECTGGNRAAVRASWDTEDRTFVVGHLANNSVEKGSVDLLRASAGAEFRILFAGPEMPNFLQFWQSFPARQTVRRLGVLSEESKRDFFAGIDVLCLPSRTDSFGLVLLEAWANGKPVVVYRAGGPADLVRDGVDGFVVRCGDVEGLRARLTQLSRNPRLVSQLGDAGRRRVLAEFQWEDKLRLVRDCVANTVAQPR